MRQIIAAASRSQIIVVSHAAPLVDVAKARDVIRIDRKRLDEPAWKRTS